MRVLWLAVCLAVCAGPVWALSTRSAEEVVRAVEAAAARNDVEGQAVHFADDIVITVISPQPDGSSKTKTKNKASFVADELESQREVSSHRYESSLLDLTLNPDGRRATARVQARISFESDGRQYAVESDQVIAVELRQGTPRIVAVTSTITGATLDGQKVF